MKRVSVLLGMVTGILNKQNDFTINLKEHGWYRDFDNVKILPSLIKANFPIRPAGLSYEIENKGDGIFRVVPQIYNANIYNNNIYIDDIIQVKRNPKQYIEWVKVKLYKNKIYTFFPILKTNRPYKNFDYSLSLFIDNVEYDKIEVTNKETISHALDYFKFIPNETKEYTVAIVPTLGTIRYLETRKLYPDGVPHHPPELYVKYLDFGEYLPIPTDNITISCLFVREFL